MIKLVQPHPALLLQTKKERMLVVADLHIGWELSLAQKGVHVPSQTPKLLNKMLQLIDLCKPTKLIFLGDVKHTVAKLDIREWQDIPDFFEVLQKKVPDIEVVPGNHDGNLTPLLPANVKILPYSGLAVEDVGLFHGHAWPKPELLQCRTLVTAHVHPTAVFRDPLGFQIREQVWVKANFNSRKLAKNLLKHLNIKVKADPTTLLQEKFNVKLTVSQLLIMPSFNNFLGGQPINRKIGRGTKSRKFIGPILRSGNVDLKNAEVYLLDGAFLGTVEHLKSLT
ncbi:MAG: metallophosphoesterase [Thermoproteota archaeon]|nr:metallophosphoesterase [Thermoproteota archaeon]